MRAVAAVMRLPVLTRSFVVGAACTGAIGCVAGLTIGLLVYPPTAWMAIFELGIPAAIVGGVVGLLSGSVVLAVRGWRDRTGFSSRNPTDDLVAFWGTPTAA